jgi:hypothetical protein
MRRLPRFIPLVLFVLFSSNPVQAQLTVKTTTYGSKPGYIDQATLVIEPHGGYVEQSLYLTYADHNQFPGSSAVEIVHRFPLPANAVANDLWLWMGDSVMQAIMLSTWSARAIYDSITSSLHDPAFFAKYGSQYELHIFPLTSGSMRKVRINFITPTRWFGKVGVAELPLQLLKGNNATAKPLELLFRVREPVWGTPSIQELPTQSFDFLKDTNGYSFTRTGIADVSGLSSMTVRYTTDFVDGVYFASTDRKNDGTYFEFGFDPGTVFPVAKDSSMKRVIAGIDLSGRHNKNFVELMPRLKQALVSAAKPTDSITIVVAGSGDVRTLAPGRFLAIPDSIMAVIDRFAAGAWGRDIGVQRLKHVLYTDHNATVCWQFPGLDDLATYEKFGGLTQAIRTIPRADVVASYEHGGAQIGSDSATRAALLDALDSMFVRGGRLLSFYDHNRSSDEIGSQYIKGLSIHRMSEASVVLTRNPAGNIGMLFPETFQHIASNYLTYAPDPAIKQEVLDPGGHPVVISKRIKNGLIVVTSLWMFRDDGAQRALIGVPLLGLNASDALQELIALLGRIKERCATEACDKAIIASNADTLFPAADANAWAQSYRTGFASPVPPFTTINLLDGSTYLPSYVTVDQVQYYGSGALLKSVADATNGRHFETHLYPWNTICSLLNPFTLPLVDSLSMTAVAGAGPAREIREVDPAPEDANKARFFIGAAPFTDSLSFSVRAWFANLPGERDFSRTLRVTHDSTHMDPILPSMLANEHLRDLFAAKPRDTVAIVKLAVRNRLLCDFTAFIALEPNDTLHFMRDPFDESMMTEVPLPPVEASPDSVSLAISPNPFHRQTIIAYSIKGQASVRIAVYDMLGREVRVLESSATAGGNAFLRWDGTDGRGVSIPAGVYYIRLIAQRPDGRPAISVLRTAVLMR